MAGNSIQFGIRISADGSQANAEMRRFGQNVGDVNRDLERTARSAEALTGSFARMGHGLVAALSVRELAQAADAFTNLNSRLGLITASAAGAARAYADVLAIAQQTRQGLAEVGQVYERFGRNAYQLALSQERLAGLTRTVAESIAISGASAESAQAALVQFGQGLASGTLRGEELNSVLEQAPRLAQALAEGLGVSVGELRKLGEAGAITSQAIVTALEKEAPKLAAEFERMPITIGGALTQVKNAFTDAVGSIEQSTGVFHVAAEGLSSLANHMEVAAGAAGVLAAAMAGRMAASLAAYVSGQAAALQAGRLAQAQHAAEAAGNEVITQTERRKLAAYLENLAVQRDIAANAAARLAIQEAEVAANIAQMSGIARLTAVETQLVGARHARAAADAELTAAEGRLAAAQGAATASAGLARGALALLGGPIGLVTTALTLGATAWMVWGDKSEAALDETGRKVESLTERMQKLNASIAQASWKDYSAALAEAKSKLQDIDKQEASLRARLASVQDGRLVGEYWEEQAQAWRIELHRLGEQRVALAKQVADAERQSAEVSTAALDRLKDEFATKSQVQEKKLRDLVVAYRDAVTAISDDDPMAGQKRQAALDQYNAKLRELTAEQKKTRQEQSAAAREAQAYAALLAQLSGLDTDYAKDLARLYAAYQDGRLTVDAYREAVEKLIAKQPFAKELARQQAEADKAAQAAIEARTKALAAAVDAEARHAAGLEEGNTRTREEIEAMGLGTEALAALTAEKLRARAETDEFAASQLEEAATLLETSKALPEVAAGYRRMAEEKRRAARAAREGADLEIERAGAKASQEAQAKVEEQWKHTADTIEQSLTDALMRGFERGEDFGENLKKTLANMFRTLVLRPLIQPVAQGASSMVLQAMGMPAGAAGGYGTGNDLVGMLKQGYGLYDYGSQLGLWGSSAGAVGSGGMVSAGVYEGGQMVSAPVYESGLGSSSASYGGAGTAASAFGGAMSGYQLGYQLTGSKTGGYVGAAAGAYAAYAIPYVGWVLAAAALLAGSMGGGTPHVGSAVLTNVDDTQQRLAHKYQLPDTYVWGGFKDGDGFTAPLKQMGADIARSIEGTLSAFGADRQVSVYTAFGADGEDESRGQLRIYDEAGRLIGSNGGAAVRGKKYDSDPQKGFQQFAADAGAAIRDALIAADLPAWADDVLASIGKAPSMDALNAALGQIQQLRAAAERLAPALGLTEDNFVKIMEAVGGDALNAYFDGYYSQGEKLSMATDQVAEQFAALGLTMPDTRDGFRALVESLDTTTDSGRTLYAQLIALSPAFGQVADAAADAAQQAADAAAQAQQRIDQQRYGLETQLLQLQGNSAALRARELDQLDDSNRALQTYIWALQDAAGAQQSAAQTASAAAQQAADAQAAAHQQVADAQAALQSAYESQASSLQQTIDRFGDLAQRLHALRTSLLTGSESPLSAAARDAEVARQFDAIARRAQLGDPQAIEDLQSISSQYLDVSRAAAGSAEDYYRRFAHVQDVLGKSESVASRQASIAQEQLGALHAQIGTLLDIDQSVGSVASAIVALRAALDASSAADAAAAKAAADAAAAGGSSSTDTSSTTDPYRAVVDQAFRDVLGRDAAAAGMDYWTGQLKSGAVSLDALYGDIAYGAQGADQDAARAWLIDHGYVPAFDVGTNYVPSDMLAMVHAGERIIPAADNRDLMRALDRGTDPGEALAALRTELRALRDEVARLRAAADATARHTSRTARQVERWDGDGMPEVRAA